MADRTDRLLGKMKTKKVRRPEFKVPIGGEMFLPNHSGDHSRGRVRVTPTTDYEIANKAYVDASGGGSGDSVTVSCRKGSVGTIALGSPVYISGYSGSGWVQVEEADADDPTKMPAVGLAAEAITNSATATYIIVGNLQMDTSAFSVQDEVWVHTTAGALTATKPTGTAAIQKMGVVMRSHASLGQMAVFGAGRSNDVPNIPSTNFWVGNGSAVATAVAMSSDATMDNAGAVTIANDAVTLAKMASGTDGNLITYDASGDPAAVATGTATQVLTSNGAGAAPTFQTETITHLQTFSPSAATAEQSYSNDTNYDYYLVFFNILKSSSTGASNFEMRLNGVSTGYKQSYTEYSSPANPNTSAFQFGKPTTGSVQVGGMITIHRLEINSAQTSVSGTCYSDDQIVWKGGRVDAGGAITSITFDDYQSDGTLTGEINIYGVNVP